MILSRLVNAGRGSTSGQRSVALPNLRLAPKCDTKHMLDELKASAYMRKERSDVAFEMRQNAFPAGAPPRTRWGRLRRSPDPIVGWGGDTLLHIQPPLGAEAAPRFGGNAPKWFSLQPCQMNAHTVSILMFYRSV